ncbi:MAG TPA: hypothetical protein VIR60_10005 [Gammaproteobacteria bacterium]
MLYGAIAKYAPCMRQALTHHLSRILTIFQYNEIHTAILLPSGGIVVRRDRVLFSITLNGHTLGTDAMGDEEIAYRGRTCARKFAIVFIGPDRIRMAFDQQIPSGIRLEEIDQRLQVQQRARLQDRAPGFEQNVLKHDLGAALGLLRFEVLQFLFELLRMLLRLPGLLPGLLSLLSARLKHYFIALLSQLFDALGRHGLLRLCTRDLNALTGHVGKMRNAIPVGVERLFGTQ